MRGCAFSALRNMKNIDDSENARLLLLVKNTVQQ